MPLFIYYYQARMFYHCSMLQTTLFSAMDLVVNLMREVEEKEKVAKQAKEEASSEGHDIYFRIEELKLMLAYAKEANDMVVSFLFTSC